MKQYFIDKLQTVKNNITSISKSTVSNVEQGQFNDLLIQGKRLVDLKEQQSSLIKDCLKYCTIDEIVEIGTLKEKYSNDEPLNLLSKREVECYFKYNGYGISIEDRNKLVTAFGSLNDIKIK